MSSSFFILTPALGRRSAVELVLGFLLLSACVRAQQPMPASPAAASSHAPVLTLVEPLSGGTLPRDRPVAVFRFAAGDAADSINAQTFAISVDGIDRSALFHATREIAVGLLVADSAADSAALAPGIHQLHARVCSLRGVCSDLDASVTVIPAEPPAQSDSAAKPDSTAEGGSPVSLIRMLLELVLALARKLIAP